MALQTPRKNKLTTTAHCLVRNEARYVWFSVMSVIKYVDKVLLWDTGSTDETGDIIKEILKTEEGKKVDFREIGEVDPLTFTKTRQKMLEKTETDWFVIVDGDEVWWDDSIKNVVDAIQENGDKLESIVVPTINLVGDIYHYQEEAAGNYELAGKKGHLNLRGINRKIPGLHFDKPHGQQGLFDENGTLIQSRDKSKRNFLNLPYLHFTNVPRSTSTEEDTKVPKRKQKLKFEMGIPFPADFYYPEVFFRPKPDIVPSPWQRMTKEYRLRASLESPIRRLKRRLWSRKVGY